MKSIRRQKGATLLVGMIMLVVLTLLVVFAIRSSNTGLQIAGNMQAQIEANGATAKAIEAVIDQIKVSDMDVIAALIIATPTVTVQVGDKSFKVTRSALSCEVERPILEEELTDTAEDVACYGDASSYNPQFTASGTKATTKASECKAQGWKIEAAVIDDAVTGASVTQVQGIGIRVPTVGVCP